MSFRNHWFWGIAAALFGFSTCFNEGCVTSTGPAGSGVSASETRQVQSFTALRLEGFADIDATISDHTEVIVTADDNLLPIIKTSIEGDALVIRETENMTPKINIHITIKTPSLNSVTIAGAGNVSINDLKESSFNVDMAGAGSVAANGNADKLKVTLSGAGNANLADLTTQDASVSLTGAGNANVNSAATLDVTLTGAGNVSYKGSPHVTQHIIGAGSVTQM